ncbi:MAG: site-2 protease family protein [Zoogloeaceae bacterium]|jgi:Zn-dependent protease|nr:site-2 protease family protein [Zoogloeaceae bacterium]
MDNSLLANMAIAVLPLIFAITLHEAAHAYVARYFGDDTAARQGRITLNPLPHVDPIGTLLLPAGLFLLSGGMFAFGYAKPVPVDFSRLRRPKQDMFWVAAAGPFANLLMAIAWALLHKLMFHIPVNPYYTQALVSMCLFGATFNVLLMLLNLLPLPPLDGGRIVVSLLPLRQAIAFSRIEPYGMLILIFLLVTNLLSALLEPMIRFCLLLLQPFL